MFGKNWQITVFIFLHLIISKVCFAEDLFSDRNLLLEKDEFYELVYEKGDRLQKNYETYEEAKRKVHSFENTLNMKRQKPLNKQRKGQLEELIAKFEKRRENSIKSMIRIFKKHTRGFLEDREIDQLCQQLKTEDQIGEFINLYHTVSNMKMQEYEKRKALLEEKEHMHFSNDNDAQTWMDERVLNDFREQGSQQTTPTISYLNHQNPSLVNVQLPPSQKTSLFPDQVPINGPYQPLDSSHVNDSSSSSSSSATISSFKPIDISSQGQNTFSQLNPFNPAGVTFKWSDLKPLSHDKKEKASKRDSNVVPVDPYLDPVVQRNDISFDFGGRGYQQVVPSAPPRSQTFDDVEDLGSLGEELIIDDISKLDFDNGLDRQRNLQKMRQKRFNGDLRNLGIWPIPGRDEVKGRF